MDNKQLSKLLSQQQKILSKIALGQTLSEIGKEICLAIEGDNFKTFAALSNT